MGILQSYICCHVSDLNHKPLLLQHFFSPAWKNAVHEMITFTGFCNVCTSSNMVKNLHGSSSSRANPRISFAFIKYFKLMDFKILFWFFFHFKEVDSLLHQYFKKTLPFYFGFNHGYDPSQNARSDIVWKEYLKYHHSCSSSFFYYRAWFFFFSLWGLMSYSITLLCLWVHTLIFID